MTTTGTATTKTSRRLPRAPTLTESAAIVVVVGLQCLCGLFFVYDLAATVFGWRTEPTSWSWIETLQILATIGLLLGMVLGGLYVRSLLVQRARAAERLRAAAGEFHNLVQDRFAEWGLTPSERDVATFVLKGMSNQEIADLRQTSAGTIKAQTAALFSQGRRVGAHAASVELPRRSDGSRIRWTARAGERIGRPSLPTQPDPPVTLRYVSGG